MTEPGGPNPRASTEYSNLPRSLSAPTRSPSWRQASSSYRLASLLPVRPTLFPSSHPKCCNPSRRQIWFRPSLAGSLSVATSVLRTFPPPGKMRCARLFVMCLGLPLPSPHPHALHCSHSEFLGLFLAVPSAWSPRPLFSHLFFSAVPSSVPPGVPFVPITAFSPHYCECL